MFAIPALFLLSAFVPGVLSGLASTPPLPSAGSPAGTDYPRPSVPCAYGTLRSNNTSGLNLTTCTVTGSNASAFWATVYENLTGNVSWPLSFTNAWGDGNFSNLTRHGNPLNGFSHNYTVSGTYQMIVTGTDHLGRSVSLSQRFVVNVTGPGSGSNASALSAFLWGAPTAHGNISLITFVWQIHGGVPPYTGRLAFGDGHSVGYNNSSIAARGFYNHSYAWGNGSRTYGATLSVWDSAGNSTSADWNVTIRFNGTGNVTGVDGTLRAATTGLPLAGVGVSLCPMSSYNGSPCGASNSTDVHGGFFVPASAGTYELTAGSSGWNPIAVRVVVTTGTVLSVGTLFLNASVAANNSGVRYGTNAVWIQLANGSVNLSAHLVLEANASAPGFLLIIWANLTGAPPIVLNQTYGDGSSWGHHANPTSGNSTRWTLGVGYDAHVYNATGPYWYVISGADANGSRVAASVNLTYNPHATGNQSYPAPVGVVIDVSNVEGPAPLPERLQAFLTGGSPP
ncbi:MAG: hypothetical protein L3K08_05565, partial [Thermoplasmata archaeon]|nr:hypothetical protein [Thermoplasmata archaeon]